MINAFILSSQLFFPCHYSTIDSFDRTVISHDYYNDCIDWYSTITDVEFLDIVYTSDNLKIKGIIAKPKNIQDKLPVIVYCRGGSNDSGKITVCTLKEKFYQWVKNGYIVIASQYRGAENSQGFDELGGDDVNDVINSFAVAMTLSYADSSSIYMVGHSRGAMMALMALRKISPMIKAVAITSAVTDFFSLEQLRPDLIPLFNQMIPMLSTKKDEAYTKRSAVCWVDEIKVPILVMHSNSDNIIDVTQSRALVEVLEKHQKIYKSIFYDEGSHSLQEHQDQVHEEIVAWFRKYF